MSVALAISFMRHTRGHDIDHYDNNTPDLT